MPVQPETVPLYRGGETRYVPAFLDYSINLLPLNNISLLDGAKWPLGHVTDERLGRPALLDMSAATGPALLEVTLGANVTNGALALALLDTNSIETEVYVTSSAPAAYPGGLPSELGGTAAWTELASSIERPSANTPAGEALRQAKPHKLFHGPGGVDARYAIIALGPTLFSDQPSPLHIGRIVVGLSQVFPDAPQFPFEVETEFATDLLRTGHGEKWTYEKPFTRRMDLRFDGMSHEGHLAVRNLFLETGQWARPWLLIPDGQLTADPEAMYVRFAEGYSPRLRQSNASDGAGSIYSVSLAVEEEVLGYID